MIIPLIMRTAVFWVIMQQVVVILYQHFGTTYCSCVQGSRFFLFLDFEDGIDRLSWIVGQKLPLLIA